MIAVAATPFPFVPTITLNTVCFTYVFRAYPNNRVVMRPSEKFEAKAAGQKGSPEVVCSMLRTFLADNAGIGLPLGIERVIWIRSKIKK